MNRAGLERNNLADESPQLGGPGNRRVFTVRKLFCHSLVDGIGGFKATRMDKDESALNPQLGVTLALIVGIILGSASLNFSGWSSIADLFRSGEQTAQPRGDSP
jgi:hypothetical protein